MAIRIIKAHEPMRVETVVVTIYAPPGVGKTSLAFSAEQPLLLDTDQGAYRSAFRRDAVPAARWEDIAGITRQDVEPYRTLVLDTAGRALDLLAADIMRRNPKMGRGGALTLQGFGQLKSEFTAYLKLMRSFGLDIVLIAHSDERQQGDEMVERIDMQGASKQEVYKSSDAMARLGIVGGRRVLTFSPTETRFGKDPAGIGAVEVPHLAQQPDFLAHVIRRIKGALNAQSEEQREQAARAAEEAEKRAAAWLDSLEAAETAEDFTALIPEARDNGEKLQLMQAAQAKGFTYQRSTSAFVATEQPSPNGNGAPKGEPAGQQGGTWAEKPPTEKQMRRLFAIAKDAGYSDEGLRRMLADRFQLGGPSEITRGIYEEVCEAAEDEELAREYAHDPAQAGLPF